MAVLEGTAEVDEETLKKPPNVENDIHVNKDEKIEETEEATQASSKNELNGVAKKKQSKKSNVIAPIDKTSVHKICSGQVRRAWERGMGEVFD